MGVNIHEHKRYYYTFDNSLLFTESIQNTYTNLFHANFITSGFFPGCARAGIMQYVYVIKPCVHRFNYSRTLPQRSSPSGLWT